MKYILILPLIILITGCLKNYEITSEDLNYLITENDIYPNITPHKYKLFKDNKKYYFNKSINNYGYYFIYNTTLIANENNNLNITVTYNKFYKKEQIKHLYNANSLIKQLFPDSVSIINPKECNCEDGYYIKDNNLFYLEIMNNTVLYTIRVEGNYQDPYKNIIKVLPLKINNLLAL